MYQRCLLYIIVDNFHTIEIYDHTDTCDSLLQLLRLQNMLLKQKDPCLVEMVQPGKYSTKHNYQQNKTKYQCT